MCELSAEELALGQRNGSRGLLSAPRQIQSGSRREESRHSPLGAMGPGSPCKEGDKALAGVQPLCREQQQNSCPFTLQPKRPRFPRKLGELGWLLLPRASGLLPTPAPSAGLTLQTPGSYLEPDSPATAVAQGAHARHQVTPQPLLECSVVIRVIWVQQLLLWEGRQGKGRSREETAIVVWWCPPKPAPCHPQASLSPSCPSCHLTCCDDLHGHSVTQLQQIRVLPPQLHLLTQCQGRVLQGWRRGGESPASYPASSGSLLPNSSQILS